MLSDLTCWFHGWQGPVRDSHMLTTDGPPLPSSPLHDGQGRSFKTDNSPCTSFPSSTGRQNV